MRNNDISSSKHVDFPPFLQEKWKTINRGIALFACVKKKHKRTSSDHDKRPTQPVKERLASFSEARDIKYDKERPICTSSATFLWSTLVCTKFQC